MTCHKYFWCWNCKGLPCDEKVSTIGTYRFHELKLLSFLDTTIRHGIISSGTRSFLTVTETLAGTLGGLRKHLTASIGTVELRILIRGCLQSDTDQYNRIADRWRNSHLLQCQQCFRSSPTNHVLGEVRDTPITKNYGGLLIVPLGKS